MVVSLRLHMYFFALLRLSLDWPLPRATSRHLAPGKRHSSARFSAGSARGALADCYRHAPLPMAPPTRFSRTFRPGMSIMVERDEDGGNAMSASPPTPHSLCPPPSPASATCSFAHSWRMRSQITWRDRHVKCAGIYGVPAARSGLPATSLLPAGVLSRCCSM